MDFEGMVNWFAEVQPAVAKLIDDEPEFVRVCGEVSPETSWVGRAYTTDQSLDNPEEAAREHFDRIMRKAMVHDVDAWEGFNETAVDSEDRWRRIGRFDGELARLLHGEGVKYVAGCFGVGHPTQLEFANLPEVVGGWSEADYIGCHEYCAPTMWDERAFSPPYEDKEDYLTTGWFTLRYRQWYPLLPPEARKPLLVTECGIDSGAAHWPVGGQGGWESFTGVPGYIEQLAWYDRQLRMDDYVVGATIFTFGTRDPTWETFDMWEPPEARQALAEYIISQQEEPIDWEAEAKRLRRILAAIGVLVKKGLVPGTS